MKEPEGRTIKNMITVRELKSLLDTLDDTDYLYTRTSANTGNIGIISPEGNNHMLGFIDVSGKRVERYD